jgi:DNA-binding NarL/FixJ family response regulator
MKILLADDHELIRSGLRNELVQLGPDVAFVEAWDGESLRRNLDVHDDLDLALVDLTMPGMQGAQTIAALRRAHPTVPLVVLSGNDDSGTARSVLQAGAAGFVPKSGMSRVMLQAIRLVLAGGRYLPPQLLPSADDDRGDTAARDHAVPGDSAHRARLGPLSPRQREVLALMAKGLSNKRIAGELDVTEGTVKTHVAMIFDVLNVHNRVSAVAEAKKLFGDLDERRSTAE